jgi:hypothetical protein
MTSLLEGSEQEPGSIPIETPRPPRLNFGVYVLVVVLLYIGDLISGVWLLLLGLSLTTPYLSLASLLNWAGAWVLCYFGYRRSKVFGYLLVILTVILTVLIIGLVILAAWYLAASNE